MSSIPPLDIVDTDHPSPLLLTLLLTLFLGYLSTRQNKENVSPLYTFHAVSQLPGILFKCRPPVFSSSCCREGLRDRSRTRMNKCGVWFHFKSLLILHFRDSKVNFPFINYINEHLLCFIIMSKLWTKQYSWTSGNVATGLQEYNQINTGFLWFDHSNILYKYEN